MAVVLSLLAAISRLALVTLIGYAVIRFAQRWPRATLVLLLVLVTAGSGALACAWHQGFRVDPATRKMTFGSGIGQWCYVTGGLTVLLGLPALPLVAVARAPNGAAIGPVGIQWLAVLFGYFLACLIWSMALYSLLTGVVK